MGGGSPTNHRRGPNYLGLFSTQWIWGGDFNRPPEVMIEQGLQLQARACTPQGEGSRCTVGGLIEYFLVPDNEPNMSSDCKMIRGSTIRPHYPVEVKVDRRPHPTRVSEPIVAKKWPEGAPEFPKPSWPQAKTKLEGLGWKYTTFSTMNPMQAYYIDQLDATDQASVLGDQYCEWSATLTVQNISQHFQEDREIKKYIGLGQPMEYSYSQRPKRKPKENIRIKTIGFLTDVYKLMTRIRGPRLERLRSSSPTSLRP